MFYRKGSKSQTEHLCFSYQYYCFYSFYKITPLFRFIKTAIIALRTILQNYVTKW